MYQRHKYNGSTYWYVTNWTYILVAVSRLIEHFSFNIAQDPDITTQQSGTTLSENSMITLKGMFYMSFDVLMPRNLTIAIHLSMNQTINNVS
jgi:hypothetical protein